MEIKFENIILRDMIESDIEDYVRWFTVEREWENWDAPWEKADTDEESERRSWGSYYESVKQLPDDVLRWKLEIEWNGRHIGWVSSYHIGEDYKWVGEIEAGQIGISCIQTVVRGADANVARGDVQRGSLQSLIAVCDRDRRPVRALRADLQRVVAVDRVVCGGNGQLAAFDRQQLRGLQSLFFCDGAYQHMN